MPTNIADPLPRVPQTAEALDLRRRTLALMRDVTIRPPVREALDRHGLRERRNQWLRSDGRRGTEIVAQELVDLANAGASRAELLQVVGLLTEVVEDLFAGQAPDLASAELAEIHADLAEDAAQQRAHVLGESDPERLERARLCRIQGAAAMALARELEASVRRKVLGLHRRTA